ncbi:MAG: hypothetical protein EAZ95_10665 [Bacteroidetes bacterium]|nr:MAG: hypothetical protein EAZ95_10665 [Bacteroidota bacterium]
MKKLITWNHVFDTFAETFVKFARGAKDSFSSHLYLKHVIVLHQEDFEKLQASYPNVGAHFIQKLKNLLASIPYNPNTYFDSLEHNLICVTISKDSHLYHLPAIKQAEGKICGKYIDFVGFHETLVWSEEEQIYETREGSMAFVLGYPTPDDRLVVSPDDFVDVNITKFL